MRGGIKIERIAVEQWERVRAVRLRALVEAPDAFGTTLAEVKPQPDAWWQRRLNTEATVTLLGSDERGDLGMVVGTPWDGQPGTAGLFGMWVAPEARGCGIGGALVDAVVQWAVSSGYQRMLLDVANENAAAIALYESRRFFANGVTGTLPPPRDHVLEHQRERCLRNIFIKS